MDVTIQGIILDGNIFKVLHQAVKAVGSYFRENVGGFIVYCLNEAISETSRCENMLKLVGKSVGFMSRIMGVDFTLSKNWQVCMVCWEGFIHKFVIKF